MYQQKPFDYSCYKLGILPLYAPDSCCHADTQDNASVLQFHRVFQEVRDVGIRDTYYPYSNYS
jgi:hypothetical protein